MKKRVSMSNSFIPQGIKVKVLRSQRNICAGKTCAKLHNGTQKMKVDLTDQFVHIKSESMGGETTYSNIQALCPKCYREKNRAERVRIKKDKKNMEKKILI